MLFAMLAGTIAPMTQVPLPKKSPAMIRLLPILVLLAAIQVSAGETFAARVSEVTNKKTPRSDRSNPGRLVYSSINSTSATNLAASSLR
jgi:hypothetical protein